MRIRTIAIAASSLVLAVSGFVLWSRISTRASVESQSTGARAGLSPSQRFTDRFNETGSPERTIVPRDRLTIMVRLNGSPLAGASIRAVPWTTALRDAASTRVPISARIAREGFQEFRTDDEGIVSVDSESSALFIAARGIGTGPAGVEWSGDTRELQIDLPPELVLKGTIHDEDGRPIVGARVDARRNVYHESGWNFDATWEEMVAGSVFENRVLVGADGRFEVHHVSRGEYRLECSADGFASDSRILEPPYDELIEVELARGAGVVTGTVSDKTTGLPLESAVVTAFFANTPYDPWERQSTLSDERGHFHLS